MTLLPGCLDDDIAEDKPVRVVDAVPRLNVVQAARTAQVVFVAQSLLTAVRLRFQIS